MSGSVKAIGVAKLRAANDGEERQKAVRITGFSKTKGLAGVDGIYAQNSPEAYFKVRRGSFADVLSNLVPADCSCPHPAIATKVLPVAVHRPNPVVHLPR